MMFDNKWITHFLFPIITIQLILGSGSFFVAKAEKSSFFSSNLRRTKRSLPTAPEQTELLAIHNSLRRQEPALNMAILAWNNDLATAASNWAVQCKFEHGLLTVAGFPQTVGQNIFYSTGAAMNLTKSVIDWYDEKAFYDFNGNTCQEGKDCGHYTQMVWATNTLMGCGYHTCPSIVVSPLSTLTNALELVCDYAPGGNIIGQQPYQLSPTSNNSVTTVKGTNLATTVKGVSVSLYCKFTDFQISLYILSIFVKLIL